MNTQEQITPSETQTRRAELGLTRSERVAIFGEGQWCDEPDHVVFEHAGVPCILHRQPDSGHWCGYAAVEPGHPWHGEHNYFSGRYDEDGGYTQNPESGPDVHGGVTYGQKCAGAICHVAKAGEPGDVFWLGFDAGHHGDAKPLDCRRRPDIYGEISHGHYATVDYMRAQTVSLAEQIIARRLADTTHS